VIDHVKKLGPNVFKVYFKSGRTLLVDKNGKPHKPLERYYPNGNP
jgi:hypothetical protein